MGSPSRGSARKVQAVRRGGVARWRARPAAAGPGGALACATGRGGAFYHLILAASAGGGRPARHRSLNRTTMPRRVALARYTAASAFASIVSGSPRPIATPMLADSQWLTPLTVSGRLI